jgi:hypothetical protein
VNDITVSSGQVQLLCSKAVCYVITFETTVLVMWCHVVWWKKGWCCLFLWGGIVSQTSSDSCTACCFLDLLFGPKIGWVQSSEMSVNLCQTT